MINQNQFFQSNQNAPTPGYVQGQFIPPHNPLPFSFLPQPNASYFTRTLTVGGVNVTLNLAANTEFICDDKELDISSVITRVNEFMDTLQKDLEAKAKMPSLDETFASPQPSHHLWQPFGPLQERSLASRNAFLKDMVLKVLCKGITLQDPNGSVNRAGIDALSNVLDGLVLIKNDGDYEYISSHVKDDGIFDLVITDEVNGEQITRPDYSWVDSLRGLFEAKVGNEFNSNSPLCATLGINASTDNKVVIVPIVTFKLFNYFKEIGDYEAAITHYYAQKRY
jgi:hypothetical protein